MAASVLLYAVNASDQRHYEARGWLDAALSGQESIGFSWVVLLAFLRLTTREGLFPSPLTVAESTQTIAAWLLARPSVNVAPTARHGGILTGLLTDVGTAGNLVTDAHLAALALEHDATVVTYDADFGRFPGVRWERPGT